MNTVTFYCQACGGKEAITNVVDLKKHLAEVHQITGLLQGSQQALAFLDGAKGFFAQEWEVTLKPSGLKLTKVVEGTK
jgi:hypothetical protein